MPTITSLDLSNAKLDVDHIAAIATSLQPTATDRLGHTKDTISGAVYKIASFTDRGVWVASTNYQVKDLVSVSVSSVITWYVCVVQHTSSSSFSTDSSSKWRIYQGVTTGDLSATDGSDLVGFQQTGSDFVIPATDKFKQTVSVEEFGLLGTGDDTLVFQKALNSLSIHGGVLKLPAGIQAIISAPLTPKTGTTIDLNGSTIRQKTNSNLENMIFVGPTVSKINVVNGTIDINVANQSYTDSKGNVGRGVLFYQTNSCSVDNVKFINPYGSMVLAAGSSKINVYNCDINDQNATGHYGIEFNSCTDCEAAHNTGIGKIGQTGYGIYAFGPTSNVRAFLNNFKYWQIDFIGTDYITFGGSSSMVHCRIDHNTLTSPSADTSIHFGLYGSVCNNIIIDSRDVGISMDYSRNTVINNNIIRTTNAAGIALPGCIDNTVIGNTISNPGSQFVIPVDPGQRCGIWVPIRPFESAPTIAPTGNNISNNTIRDSLPTPQMYIGISVADIGGNNTNFVTDNYITGSILVDLDIPNQTNVGSFQSIRYLSLSNSWVSFGEGHNTLNCYKDDIGTVFISGQIKSGTNNTVITNLPSGYRPQFIESYIVLAGSGSGRIDIFPNGDVLLVAGSNSIVSLSGISFSTRV